VTRVCVHNFSIALTTCIPYMHEYLRTFLNDSFGEWVWWIKESGLWKRDDLTYLKTDFKYVTEEGRGWLQ